MDISTIHLGGWKRQEADPRDYNIEHEKIAPHIKITTAPIKWVLSDKDTPIKDQRTYGSCTAFAGTGGVMYWLKQMNLFKDLSEFFLYWWSRVIDTGGDPTGDDGSTIRSMMSALVKYGVPPEIEFPYLDSNFNKKPPVVKDAVTVAKYYAIAEDSSKVANMKQSIYSGVPVVFGSEVGNGIFNVGKDGKEPYELKYVGGHARVCLDYDDTMVIPGTKVLGAF
jgi:C1A family cysteine protease